MSGWKEGIRIRDEGSVVTIRIDDLKSMIEWRAINCYVEVKLLVDLLHQM